MSKILLIIQGFTNFNPMFKYLLLSILSGILLGQSFLSQGLFFLVFVGFVPLMWLEHQLEQEKRKRKSLYIALFSYLSFAIWNAVAYWWLHLAKDPDGSYAWLAFTLPVFLNSLFMTVCFMLYHWVKRLSGNFYGLLFLPLMWITFEKLHLEWEFSYPWLNLGNVFAWKTTWIQWYEYTGSFGGTFWVIVVNILFFYQLQAYKNTKQKKFLAFLLAYSTLLIGVPVVSSYIIYNNYHEKGKKVRLTVLQPNLDSYQDKYERLPTQIVQDLIDLMKESNEKENTDFFIAPETAFPGRGSVDLYKVEENEYVQSLVEFLSTNGEKTLVSGVEFYRESSNKDSLGEFAFSYPNSNLWYERFNSAIALEGNKLLGVYHKSKMVPGVEILPYQNTVGKLFGSVILDFGGSISSLTPQRERTTFHFPKQEIKAAPLICYESIYGEFTGKFILEGNANIFFIMTNDSWWEESDGHRQLLAYAKLRAIEHRRPIARAANTGISAFINAKGGISKQLAYGEKGFLTESVTLNKDLTFYTRYGDYIARVALLLWGIILGYSLAEMVLKRIKETKMKQKRKI